MWLVALSLLTTQIFMADSNVIVCPESPFIGDLPMSDILHHHSTQEFGGDCRFVMEKNQSLDYYFDELFRKQQCGDVPVSTNTFRNLLTSPPSVAEFSPSWLDYSLPRNVTVCNVSLFDAVRLADALGEDTSEHLLLEQMDRSVLGNNGFTTNRHKMPVTKHTKKGPVIVIQSEHVLVDASSTNSVSSNQLSVPGSQAVSLTCVASGSPSPDYSWYRLKNGARYVQYIDALNDERITETDGTLSISQTDSTKDAGMYQCRASNQHGVVISKPIQLQFNYVHNFELTRSPEYAYLHESAAINCRPPSQHFIPQAPTDENNNPPLILSWYRKNSFPFGTPVTNNERIFASRDGHLYFAFTAYNDEDRYQCIAKRSLPQFADVGKLGPMFYLVITPREERLQYKTSSSQRHRENGGGRGRHRSARWITSNRGNHFFKPLPHQLRRATQILPGFPKVFPHKRPRIGQDVFVECVASAFPAAPTFRWSYKSFDKNRTTLPEGAVVEQYGHVLRLDNVQIHHSGHYFCTASSPLDSSVVAASAEMQVVTTPVFISTLGNKKHRIGDSLEWRCEASNFSPYTNSTITYVWCKNGEILTDQLAENDDELAYRIRVAENVLKIAKVSSHDAGMYQCEAVNSVGSSMSTGQLFVMHGEAPHFTISSTEPLVLIPEGTALVLPCAPRADPPSRIQWLKRKQRSLTLLVDTSSSAQNQTGSFTITATATMADSGRYVCRASNRYGVAEASTLVKVVSVPGNEPGNITACSGPFTQLSGTMFVKGQNGCLLCSFNSSSFLQSGIEVTLEWLLNDILLFDGNFDDRFNLSHVTYPPSAVVSGQLQQMLTIRGASRADEGQYKCRVRTALHSSPWSSKITVHVARPPEQPINVRVVREQHQDANLKLRWTEFQAVDREYVNELYPTIMYSILGSTTEKQKSWQILTNVTAEKVTERTRSGVSETDHELELDFATNLLSPRKPYKFRIVAVNALGDSKPSLSTSPAFTVPTAKPIKFPTYIVVLPGHPKDDRIGIIWKPVAKDARSVVGYRLRYWFSYVDDADILVLPAWAYAAAATEHSVEVHGAETDRVSIEVTYEEWLTSFDVSIQAFNEVGDGPWSSVHSAINLPSPLLLVKTNQNRPGFLSLKATPLNATALKVTWLTAATHAGYVLTYKKTRTLNTAGAPHHGMVVINTTYNDGGDRQADTLDNNLERFYILYSLKGATRYKIKLVPYSKGGLVDAHDRGEVITVTTPTIDAND